MPAKSVSTATPLQLVSSFDHLVTQWISTVTVCDGSAVNSFHGHDTRCSTARLKTRLQTESGVRVVGPAESTGKSLTMYCPGGIRAGSTSRRGRPLKPRE